MQDIDKNIKQQINKICMLHSWLPTSRLMEKESLKDDFKGVIKQDDFR